MAKRESFESRVLSYFQTCSEDVGTMLFGMIASVARKRGLTGRNVAKVARRARAASKPNGKVGSDLPTGHGA